MVEVSFLAKKMKLITCGGTTLNGKLITCGGTEGVLFYDIIPKEKKNFENDNTSLLKTWVVGRRHHDLGQPKLIEIPKFLIGKICNLIDKNNQSLTMHASYLFTWFFVLIIFYLNSKGESSQTSRDRKGKNLIED